MLNLSGSNPELAYLEARRLILGLKSPIFWESRYEGADFRAVRTSLFQGDGSGRKMEIGGSCLVHNHLVISLFSARG